VRVRLARQLRADGGTGAADVAAAAGGTFAAAGASAWLADARAAGGDGA
jgi:hypothetical protein